MTEICFRRTISPKSQLLVIGARPKDFDLACFLKSEYNCNKIYEMHQTHSKLVLDLRSKNIKDAFSQANVSGLPFPKELQADGVIIDENLFSASAFIIKTADCLPVVLCHKNILALIHAGWRGLASKICTEALNQIVEAEYANELFDVYVGPHASDKNYQIQTDILKDFPLAATTKDSEGNLCLNLLETLRSELNSYPLNYNLDTDGECTIGDNRFYSHRRDSSEKLRNLTLVTIS